jgi:hypothetical protein
MEKFKKYIPQLCYVAASLNFIASTIAAISGNDSGICLSLGGLFLLLGTFYSERAKKKNDKE